jgi:hypothetical protein
MPDSRSCHCFKQEKYYKNHGLHRRFAAAPCMYANTPGGVFLLACCMLVQCFKDIFSFVQGSLGEAYTV